MDVATLETSVPTVVVAGEAAEPVGDELAADADVATVERVDAALERVGAAEFDLLADGAVDCVVATGRLADGTPAELVERVRERAADLPVVFAPAAPDPEAARDVTAAPATYYLPRELAADGDLAALVEDAVATYDQRRQQTREREMFRELLADAPLAIYVKDEDGRHLAASTMATQAADEPVIGETDDDLFCDDPDQVASSYEDDLQVVETGEPIEDQVERVELEGGKVLWLRTTKVPRRDDDGEVVGLLGVTRDVTPEKQREQELQRQKKRLEQFASFASHDLRNPVMIAQGYVERARDTGDVEWLDQVTDELDRMERLIDDLLDIARPDEERETQWTDLTSVVERAWTAVDAPEASLSVEVPEDVQIRAFSGALRQLLENLLSNAVDHGGDDVAVEVGLSETGFYVGDDGPGIPPEDREKVFEYGFTTGGTGVGLAIAAEIADAHGWEPSVTESASGGARLAFDRCLRRATDAPEPVEGESVDLEHWTTVGDLEVPGGATRDGAPAAGEAESWTIRGAGRALWVGIEEYALLHADVAGDVRIEGRVTGVERLHDYSKAGLLLADAAEPDSPLGFVGKTAAHGTEAAWRAEPGGTVDTHQAEPDAVLPRWYRIDRVGDSVTCYGSVDGEDWTMIDQHVLPLADPVAVGLAVCSHEAGTCCEATFEGVRVVELSGAEGPPGGD